MREIFTYGSVGGASGNRCSYLETMISAFAVDANPIKRQITPIMLKSLVPITQIPFIPVQCKIILRLHMLYTYSYILIFCDTYPG
ncbi:hypothetical protein BuS5_01446 [Desulfosarcina sp. BuS5]|nr:hypothetical protein BuS5_01446 [Desulfosarcina sp. BuS5]